MTQMKMKNQKRKLQKKKTPKKNTPKKTPKKNTPKKNTPKKQKNKKIEKDSDSESDSEKSEKSENSEKNEEKKNSKIENSENSEKSEKSEKSENSSKNENLENLPSNVYEELFVRNLSYSTSEQSLAEFFMKYGDVEVAQIVKDKKTQKSRGFGFVKFYEKKAAYLAMKDSENLMLDDRKLQIRYSNDKTKENKSSQNTQNTQNSNFSIFVGNLSFKSKESDIRNFFSDCGQVLDVRIAKNEEGKMKGFAHVDFDSKEAVEKAIEKNGQSLGGRELRIDASTPKGRGNSQGRGRGKPRGRGRGGNVDPVDKAKKSGAIIQSEGGHVKKFEDSDEDDD